jgi:transcriptional regulator
MYLPRKFREDRIEALHAAMLEIGAAAIVGQGPDGPIASHVPIELDPEPAPWGTIRCHFARPNPHARCVADGRELLLIFQGPQGYVTPNWYPSKRDTGKVVPTWNYVAVHAYGTATPFEDVASLRAHLGALTDRFEAGSAAPWKIDDAPADYVDGLCRAIIGLEIRLTRIEGKWKLSQNRPRHDRLGVIDGLRAQGGDASLKMAELVEAASGGGDGDGGGGED